MSRFILYANFGIWLNCSPKKILAAAVLFFLNRPSQMFYFFGGDSHSLIHSDVFFWFFFIFSLWNTKKRDISSDNEEKRGRVAQAIETIVLWWRMIDGDDHIFFFSEFFILFHRFCFFLPFHSSLQWLWLSFFTSSIIRVVPCHCSVFCTAHPPLSSRNRKKKKWEKKNCNFLVFHFLFLPAQKQESTEFHRNKLSQLSPGDYRRRVVDHSLFFLLPLIIWIPLFPLSLFSCMSLFPYLVALILV